MISNEKLQHIITVARKMYKEAKEAGYPEDICRLYFLAGYLHDIGYEWCDNAMHPQIGADLLTSAMHNSDFVEAIRQHGDPCFAESQLAVALNKADMTTGKNGVEMTMHDRVEDIGNRYGKNSETYKNAQKMQDRLSVIVYFT